MLDSSTYQKIAQENQAKGRREGREEGIELGREEGIELGREEGREEERLDIARRLLGRGAAPAEVAEVTGLSLAAVIELTH